MKSATSFSFLYWGPPHPAFSTGAAYGCALALFSQESGWRVWSSSFSHHAHGSPHFLFWILLPAYAPFLFQGNHAWFGGHEYLLWPSAPSNGCCLPQQGLSQESWLPVHRNPFVLPSSFGVACARFCFGKRRILT